jgi:hypothetical protein
MLSTFTPALNKIHLQLFPHTEVALHQSLSPYNRQFMFKPIEMDLVPGQIVKFGRKIDAKKESNRLSRDQQISFNASSLSEDDNQILAFRSKVVSRSHAELWLGKDGQVRYYILKIGIF